jgi:hypothetical protein
MAEPNSILPFPADVDRDAFGHWLSGFTAGEGCFQLRCGVRSKRPRRSLWDAQASFVIGLRRDDAAALELVRSFLGCGLVYYHPGHRRRGHVRPSVEFKVYKAADLARVIVPCFERYPLRAKKARDFAIWREGVLMLYRITQRPMRSRGYRQGTVPRWSAGEQAAFGELTRLLRKQRKYLDPPALA